MKREEEPKRKLQPQMYQQQKQPGDAPCVEHAVQSWVSRCSSASNPSEWWDEGMECLEMAPKLSWSSWELDEQLIEPRDSSMVTKERPDSSSRSGSTHWVA